MEGHFQDIPDVLSDVLREADCHVVAVSGDEGQTEQRSERLPDRDRLVYHCYKVRHSQTETDLLKGCLCLH